MVIEGPHCVTPLTRAYAKPPRLRINVLTRMAQSSVCGNLLLKLGMTPNYWVTTLSELCGMLFQVDSARVTPQ